MGVSTSTSDNSALSLVENTATNTNQQAESLQATNVALSDLTLKTGMGATTNFAVSVSDMGAINRAFDLVEKSSDKSLASLSELSMKAMGVQSDVLNKSLAEATKQTDKAIASATGESQQNRIYLLAGFSVIAIILIRYMVK